MRTFSFNLPPIVRTRGGFIVPIISHAGRRAKAQSLPRILKTPRVAPGVHGHWPRRERALPRERRTIPAALKVPEPLRPANKRRHPEARTLTAPHKEQKPRIALAERTMEKIRGMTADHDRLRAKIARLSRPTATIATTATNVPSPFAPAGAGAGAGSAGA